ncbi:hypothetical protein Acr_00g0066510 [Actinidia rufa]|uniref:Leucine-rich repeat protein kinase family protein n=1 Tax=Actinidia rufa TaxID=165716 RepID=A0A7J0DQ60_9ERIC|nr:hypothetical protein Acr_00g0066510 [Actinidia rufa]
MQPQPSPPYLHPQPPPPTKRHCHPPLRQQTIYWHQPGLPISSSPYTGFISCTSPYHSPESLENLKPDTKWDIYSFGIVLLELLTGRVFSDQELSQWTAGSVVENKDLVLGIADVAIRADVEGREDVILACFKLGLCFFGPAEKAFHERSPSNA